MTVNCLPSPVPVICIVAPSTGEPSEVSLPDKLTGKVPAAPTFPLFGNAPNDKDVAWPERMLGWLMISLPVQTVLEFLLQLRLQSQILRMVSVPYAFSCSPNTGGI